MRKVLLALGAALLAAPQMVGAAESSYRDMILALQPRVYLQLDETAGTTATDSGSNGVNGTYGASNLTLGQESAGAVLGTSIFHNHLDSSTTPVLVNAGTGSNPPSNIGTGDFTIELWFKPVIADDRQDLVNLNGSSSNDLGIFMRTSNRMEVYHTSSSPIAPVAGTTVTLDEWHHLVLVRDDGVATLYVDTNVLASVADTRTIANSPQLLGLGGKTSSNTRSFQGYLDEFALYDTALTSTQIDEHYFAVVPEPASVAAIVLAAGGLLMRKRRGR